VTFRLPPYPYDRLDGLAKLAAAHPGGMVDCSVGTPCDPPLPAVVEALASSGSERGYPASAGSHALREAAAAWLARRFGSAVPASSVAACVGTKELVASVPHVLRLRTPDKDTVLYPAVSYPTYAMGAELAGCRAVAVPPPRGRLGGLDLGAVDPGDTARALLVWSNSPSNPTGGLGNLAAEAAWGRAHGVPVFSDECYAEFTWDGPPRSVLEHGPDGVVAVHSLSKRSNLAGYRAGFVTGDPALVADLLAIRKQAGMIMPGPVQAAMTAALDDDAHAAEQFERYAARRSSLRAAFAAAGWGIDHSEAGLYLWATHPAYDCWSAAELLATEGGILVAPGELYGPAGKRHVRVALTATDERIAAAASRLATLSP
jgi:succinyldiaminopimelate transaminase